jgi:predicted Zn-dependent protease
LDTVLDKFLKTMQTTTTRLQEKLLKPEARQKGKEQVKEKARDSVLQLLSRLQAEQAQNKPAAQPRTQEGHSEI